MPNIENYENHDDWMGACMPAMTGEGREQDQAAAACENMWSEKKSFYGMTVEEAVKHYIKIGARNSRKDQERLQMMHDFSVENGAICQGGKSLPLDEVLVFQGDEVKALDGGKVAGYLVRFSDETTPDLVGDYFTNETDFGDADRTDVLYQHGFDKMLKRRKLGSGELRKDDVGVWVEAQLNLRDDYEKAVYELARNGKLGWSSGTAGHLVERDHTGKILAWPLGLDASLTPTPAEPRNHAVTLKSLIPSEAAVSDREGQNAEQSAKENTEMEKEEFKALFDEQKSAIVELVKTEAESAAAKAVDSVLDKLPEVKAKMNGQTVEVTVAEEDRPFRSLAHQMRAVKNFEESHGRNMHPRLKMLEEVSRHEVPEPTEEKKTFSFKEVMAMPVKAPLGLNEGIPSQGGFLLEPTLTDEFIKPIHDSGVFSQSVRRLPVGGNSNYGWINGVDETSRANGSRWGGVLGYHRAEAAQVTATKPKFRRINWELKAIEVLMYITEEQLMDAAQTDAIVRQSAVEELDFIVNDDILNGNGVGKALGILNSGALISVPRVTANKINHDDIVAMWQRMLPRSRGKAKWFINSEAEPQLDKLAFTSNAATTEMMSPFVSYTPSGVMQIKGRPVTVTEFNAALGTAGDILLADASEFLFWEKGGVQASVNPWIQWLTSEEAFKFTYRCDGQTTYSSEITPYKGTNTQSAFVTLSASTS